MYKLIVLILALATVSLVHSLGYAADPVTPPAPSTKPAETKPSQPEKKAPKEKEQKEQKGDLHHTK